MADLAENQDIQTDIDDQADKINGGLTSMPIDAARASIGRWQASLKTVQAEGVDVVIGKLDQLSSQLARGDIEGAQVGPTLIDLATAVETVAGSQSGVVKSALEKLAGALSRGAAAVNRNVG